MGNKSRGITTLFISTSCIGLYVNILALDHTLNTFESWEECFIYTKIRDEMKKTNLGEGHEKGNLDGIHAGDIETLAFQRFSKMDKNLIKSAF